MPEHDGKEPFDELAPIDLDALFGDGWDEEPDEGDDTGREGDESDALLVSRLFAADLADAPAPRDSPADIVAAARSATVADTSGSDRSADRPVPDRSADRARDGAVDELDRRRRRRTVVSRSLLAAAAVVVIGLGATAALTSRGGSTATSAESGDQPAAAPMFSGSAGGKTGAAESAAAATDASAPSSAAAPASSAAASGGSYATAETTAGSSSGSSATPDRAGAGSETAGAAPQSGSASESAQGSTRPPGPYNPDADGLCLLGPLPNPAFEATARVLGGGISIVEPVSVQVRCDADLPSVTGGLFRAADTSRVTVLLIRDTGGGAPFAAATVARRTVDLGDDRLRVMVSVAAHSAVTDQQLQRIATAVLATQR